MPTIYANPTQFMKQSQWLWKACALASIAFLLSGLYYAFSAPPDYQQGTMIRALFLHVPSAWMATMVYGFMAIASAAAFIWRTPLADMAAQQSALIGLVWVSLALWSGALWGRPIWGTFWVWDARVLSVFILLLLYVGYLALLYAIDEPARRALALRLLALMGAVNLPIIKFSVDWWNTLHQPASIMRLQAPAMPPVYLIPLGLMAAFALTTTMALLLVRMRSEIIRRQLETRYQDS